LHLGGKTTVAGRLRRPPQLIISGFEGRGGNAGTATTVATPCGGGPADCGAAPRGGGPAACSATTQGRRGPAAVGGVLPLRIASVLPRLRHRGCGGGGPRRRRRARNRLLLGSAPIEDVFCLRWSPSWVPFAILPSWICWAPYEHGGGAARVTSCCELLHGVQVLERKPSLVLNRR
jgi:hypothetical protein